MYVFQERRRHIFLKRLHALDFKKSIWSRKKINKCSELGYLMPDVCLDLRFPFIHVAFTCFFVELIKRAFELLHSALLQFGAGSVSSQTPPYLWQSGGPASQHLPASISQPIRGGGWKYSLRTRQSRDGLNNFWKRRSEMPNVVFLIVFWGGSALVFG